MFSELSSLTYGPRNASLPSFPALFVQLFEIGDFRAAFRFGFKPSPSTKSLIWKSVLFTCKWTQIWVWIELISIWTVSQLDSLWNSGERKLGNCLLSPVCVVHTFRCVYYSPTFSEITRGKFSFDSPDWLQASQYFCWTGVDDHKWARSA